MMLQIRRNERKECRAAARHKRFQSFSAQQLLKMADFRYIGNHQFFKGISQCRRNPFQKACPDCLFLSIDIDRGLYILGIEQAVRPGRMHGNMRMDNQHRPVWQRRQFFQDFPDARSPGRTTTDTKGNVSAEAGPDTAQLVIRKAQVPEPVQSSQNSCTVRTATGQTGSNRDFLDNMDTDAGFALAVRAQRFIGLVSQIGPVTGESRFRAGNFYAVRWFQPDRIIQADRLEYRINIMLSVITSSRNP